MIAILLDVLFLVIGIILFYQGFKNMKEYMMIENTPTSKIRSMAMGFVEIKGTISANKTIKTPFSAKECVYYNYVIQEYRVHTNQTEEGTSTTYSWDIVRNGQNMIPFFIKDETGKAYVEPYNAKFNVKLKYVFKQKAGLFGQFGNLAKALQNFDSINKTIDISSLNLQPLEIDEKGRYHYGTTRVGDRKYLEYFLAPNENIYILGTAASDPNAPGKILIRKGSNESTYLISNRSEKQLVKNIKWKMIGFFAGGGLIIILSSIILIKIITNM